MVSLKAKACVCLKYVITGIIEIKSLQLNALFSKDRKSLFHQSKSQKSQSLFTEVTQKLKTMSGQSQTKSVLACQEQRGRRSYCILPCLSSLQMPLICLILTTKTICSLSIITVHILELQISHVQQALLFFIKSNQSLLVSSYLKEKLQITTHNMDVKTLMILLSCTFYTCHLFTSLPAIQRPNLEKCSDSKANPCKRLRPTRNTVLMAQLFIFLHLFHCSIRKQNYNKIVIYV